MKIAANDDEKLALDMLASSIREVCPNDELFCFRKPKELLEFARKNSIDIAFLDINMRGMTGIELAKELKDIMPNVNIIFVTGYDEYTKQAMKLHASGYIFKPVSAEKIKEEIADLRHPLQENTTLSDKPLIKCFGNFDVHTKDGEAVKFERSKSKEVLAYIVSKEDSSCTMGEIFSALFEDAEYDAKQKAYIRKIISSMINSLKKYNLDNIVNKSFNSISVNKDMIDCDYYKFLQGDITAINSYHGEFMAQYSWSEFITGYLDNNY